MSTSMARKARSTEMSIEELAQRSGYTVRNLRAFQARGILPPPRLEGRKGFYSRDHLGRVGLVRRLQDRGYSLAAIRDFVDRMAESKPGAIDDVGRTITSDLVPQTPLRGAKVLRRFPDDATIRRRLAELEIVIEQDGVPYAPSSELVQVLLQLADDGYPLTALLDTVEKLRSHAGQVATLYRQINEKHVVGPYLAAGAPPDELPALTARLARGRALGVHLFQILLSQNLQRGGN